MNGFDDNDDKDNISGRAEDASDFCLLLPRRHDFSLHQPHHVQPHLHCHHRHHNRDHSRQLELIEFRQS